VQVQQQQAAGRVGLEQQVAHEQVQATPLRAGEGDDDGERGLRLAPLEGEAEHAEKLLTERRAHSDLKTRPKNYERGTAAWRARV
jgi:hypothetical protein